MLDIREPRTAGDYALYYDLRWRILRQPWTQEKQTERDEHESDAVHLMAWREGKLLGVGRLHLNPAGEAQIRYMAVEEGHNGSGVGSAILKELESRAALRGVKAIVLNARDGARRFYEKHGYAVVREGGLLFGIVHWEMRKTL